MTVTGGWLTALERAVPEGAGEVAASLAVVVAVVAVRRLVRRALTHDGDLPGGSRARVALSGVVTVVTGLGVVVLIGIWGMLGPLVAAYRDVGLTDVGGELVLTAVLLGGAYALIGFVGRLIDALASRRVAISEHQREVLYRLTQVSLWAVVGLVIVTLFTNDPSSLLVGAGFVGIVVGMAARQTLGAVLAGFVLMFSRPFEIGDWVEIGENEGIVTGITVVNTRLQTFDGEHVLLPNDEVTSRAITNRTRKGRLRIEIEVGVDYGCDPDRAADVALEAVRELDEILEVPTPQVVAKRFADSSVVLGVRVWIGEPSARRRWRARTAVVGAVHGAFENEGIEIPFPQRSLTLREGATLADADAGDRPGPGRGAGAEPEVAPDGGEEG